MNNVGERFWNKVVRTDECWVWTAAKVDGYGQFSVGNRRRVYAHRFSYENLVGPIPPGLQIDHLCRNRACVNPDHLEPVTAQQNTLRAADAPASINAAKTHCVHGHEFTAENIYRAPSAPNKRECRTCKRELGVKWREAQK